MLKCPIFKNCISGSGNDGISLEEDIITKQAGQGKVFAFMNDKFWMSIKSAGSAVYANRVMLDLYEKVRTRRRFKNLVLKKT